MWPSSATASPFSRMGRDIRKSVLVAGGEGAKSYGMSDLPISHSGRRQMRQPNGNGGLVQWSRDGLGRSIGTELAPGARRVVPLRAAVEELCARERERLHLPCPRRLPLAQITMAPSPRKSSCQYTPLQWRLGATFPHWPPARRKSKLAHAASMEGARRSQ